MAVSERHESATMPLGKMPNQRITEKEQVAPTFSHDYLASGLEKRLIVWKGFLVYSVGFAAFSTAQHACQAGLLPRTTNDIVSLHPPTPNTNRTPTPSVLQK